MDAFTRAIESLLHLIVMLGDLVVAGILAVELWVRGQLQALGVPHTMQTVVLVVIAVLLIVAALRLFGGLVRVAVILVLLLIAIHTLLPALG
ncbi:MAG: hypothetical protein P4L71_18320 [Acetobacteraceae bacterium]|nr:hypothetical protein [Acetobacteraceae bacterium]